MSTITSRWTRSHSYRYDALYRLIEATGREHIGQTAHDVNPQNRRDYDFVGLADFLAHPNDLQALRNYTERYAYDAVGNFDVVRHSANGAVGPDTTTTKKTASSSPASRATG